MEVLAVILTKYGIAGVALVIATFTVIKQKLILKDIVQLQDDQEESENISKEHRKLAAKEHKQLMAKVDSIIKWAITTGDGDTDWLKKNGSN